jgi:UDP-N-acetylmuramoyl-L-alanyl-D-glutamate--2,6-diaminopimelate ligase
MTPDPAAPVSVAVLRDALAAADLLVPSPLDAPPPPAAVAGIADDSRRVVPGGAFVAVRGHAADGHDFLDAAVRHGAALCIVEDAARLPGGIPALVVRDARRAAAVAAAAFHGGPAARLTLVAATGTNGKTTTVDMLRHLLDDPAGTAASIGTLGVRLGSAGAPLPGGSGLTTPGPVELQGLLRQLADAGVRTVAMETSSHALHQRRTEGVRFAAGVFTNFTRDHLDYHGTMAEYFAAKARLVACLADDGVAVVNADDPAWEALPPAPRRVTFGVARAADVHARNVTYGPRGSRFTLDGGGRAADVTLPLIGDFNVSNAVGAAAAALALGRPLDVVAARLTTMPQVPGRLERLGEGPTVLRDYAHTPDALERVLDAVRPFTPKRLIVVFGCGGDRDRGKRPQMGAIAERRADVVVLTSDNPRTEDPERILDDIEAGMTRRDHRRIEDRRAAIAELLAGKGHETYQIRGTTSHPFDEAEVVAELRAERLARGGAA